MFRPSSVRCSSLMSAWQRLSFPAQRFFSVDIRMESNNTKRLASANVLSLGEPLRLEASPSGGSWAMQADGSCLCSSAASHVLATVVCNTSEIKRTEDGGLPLQVDYSEGAYARGKVPDSLSKRERLGDREVLIARAMDRAIRPLFRPGFSYETHICAQALSRGGSEVDDHDCIEAMAINAASAAIMSSRSTFRHFAGPIGAVLVIRGPDGRFVISSGGGSREGTTGRGPSWLSSVNSTSETIAVSPDQRSSFRMLYAGTIDKTLMVEMEADQVTPSELGEALTLAQSHVAEIVKAQLSIASEARSLDSEQGREPRETSPIPLSGASYDAVDQLESEGKELIMEALRQGMDKDKAGRSKAVARVKRKLFSSSSLATMNGASGVESHSLEMAFDIVLSQSMRELCIVEGKRVDGRALDEIRQLTCKPSPLPPSFPNKLHGSALFGRGETQSLCIATVGNLVSTDPINNMLTSYLTEEQRVRQRENLIVHYEFPPWSTNETGMISGRANRREVGHGALALKALRPLMPEFADFSFLTRIVAKTTSSNGSSSMAAVCGGSMALKMAGVPVDGLVAGISVGLLSERWAAPLTLPQDQGTKVWPEEMGLHLTDGQCNYGRQALVLDIQGMEDGMGELR
jgi:polyribonucleotide nucleotidyltransferase